MDELASARYTALDFNAPMSPARVDDFVAGLQPLAGARIVDLGCGWAELLQRVLEKEPTARGIGVDRDEIALARARSNGDRRILGFAYLTLVRGPGHD